MRFRVVVLLAALLLLTLLPASFAAAAFANRPRHPTPVPTCSPTGPRLG